MGKRVFNEHGQPEYRDYVPGETLPEGWSIEPFFPGYTYENGISKYRGEEIGEGGCVRAVPGMYTNVALLDVASMHPSSIVAENLFGDKYTARFKEIMDARLAVKHKDTAYLKTAMGGMLSGYLDDEEAMKTLSLALKIPINSVYGLTAAKFDNLFRDPRNIDNIVAKRGALFMINLRDEVISRGFTAAHIKTDSIKIPDATDEIIQFVMDYGREFGYTFEHEATYSKMCLVNDAVYIARYADGKYAGEWTATGKQFQVPYVFKTLFTKEPIVFDDLCETASVNTAIYLDMNDGLPNVEKYEKELLARRKLTAMIDKLGPGADPASIAAERARYDKESSPDLQGLSEMELQEIINGGHRYRFIGKVGCFCPVKEGGGILKCMRADARTGVMKYDNVAGSSGFRWLEAEELRRDGDISMIDRTYYNQMVDDAVAAISKYGDFEWFVSD